MLKAAIIQLEWKLGFPPSISRVTVRKKQNSRSWPRAAHIKQHSKVSAAKKSLTLTILIPLGATEKPPTVFMEKSQGKQTSLHSKCKEQNKKTNHNTHTLQA